MNAESTGFPQLIQLIALCKYADQHAHCRQEQDRTENGVDLADDLVDGEDGGNKVVSEDHAVYDPYDRVGGARFVF